jgi:hypothetical protein
MAHFAQINDDNVVQQVIVIANDDCGGGQFPESEPVGQAFIASLGFSGTWLQTSYSGSFRGRYAGVQMSYNPTIDEFVDLSVNNETE